VSCPVQLIDFVALSASDRQTAGIEPPFDGPHRGARTSGKTTTFFENSTTGRHFVVVIAHGRIVSENVKPFALVF
jgi:hypothetical protein